MSTRTIMALIFLGVVFLTLLNLPPPAAERGKAVFRDLLAPLQSGVAGATFRFGERVRTLRGLRDMAQDNRRLSELVVRLRLDMQQMEALEAENQTLRRLLQFQQRSPRRLLLCDVIGRDVTGWWQTIRLGNGSEDGLTPGLAVITPDGLVGKTGSVSPHTCDVLLLSEPTCKVSARIRRSGAFGVLSGRGPVGSGAQVVCRLDYLNKDLPLMPGDEVVTSGLGGTFPAGLLIGYVERVQADPSGLFHGADVIPKADLGLLDFVFVVLGEEQEAPREEVGW